MKKNQPVELAQDLAQLPKGTKGQVVEQQKTAVIVAWDTKDGKIRQRFDKYFELQLLIKI